MATPTEVTLPVNSRPTPSVPALFATARAGLVDAESAQVPRERYALAHLAALRAAAAVLAARSYLAQKDTRNASRLLQKAWEAQPHPALAAVYAEIVPDETPAQRLRRFDDLLRHKPDHPETRMLRAELALAA